MRKLVVLAATGLTREAKILEGAGIRPVPGGGDGVRLEAFLDHACAGAGGVISIGLGGALAEGLKPGDWVVASRVGQTETDRDWARGLMEILPGARLGPIAGSDVMLVDAAAKAALHAATGALAVDMESHIAARVAARHGLPFAAARAISDAADRALPRAAQAGMRPDGGMDVLAVIAALARRPWELPALIRTGVEAEAAFRALLRGRQLLGPALGRPRADLG